MSRVPIRWRLTVVFAAVMALVLVGTGLLVTRLVGGQLDRSTDSTLRARATEVAELLRQSSTDFEPARQRLARRVASAGQVVDGRGRTIDLSPGLRGRPLISAAQLASARRVSLFTSHPGIPGLEGPLRVLAQPLQVEEQRFVVIVAASRGERDRVLGVLRNALLVGGPLALLLAALAGYGVAAAALRPVEAMGARAAEVSGRLHGRRLPVSPAGDELTRLGLTLNAMLDRLEDAADRERRFTADASHELRTPLTVLRAEIDLALSQPREAPALAAALRSAGDETDRLSRLAEDLLVLARLDEDVAATAPASVDLAGLVDDVAARARPAAAHAGREIVTAAEAGLAVRADGAALERALTNLVDNALRHGGGRIRIDAARADGQLELCVSDAGTGFDPAILEHAFERFARGPGDRAPGTGLGLAIVAATARAAGGRAHAANLAAGGAQVRLVFPSV